MYCKSGMHPNAIYIEPIKPLFVLNSGLKCEWQPILTLENLKKKKIKKIKGFFMQLFSADPTILKKK